LIIKKSKVDIFVDKRIVLQ